MMREGFTTGSCAAAAAKAAVFMLLSGSEKKQITIITPKGVPYAADVVDIEREPDHVRCAVIKDGGDDPDVTTGARIVARVEYLNNEEENKTEGSAGKDSIKTDPSVQTQENGPKIRIKGGEGIGVVTRPGLDQPPGEAAINSVPRAMIRAEVGEVLRAFDCHRDICVTLSVPGGAALAQKTFNANLGIENGISIIGTTGIVEPMSQKAILDTIRLEMRQRYEEGQRFLSITPGNYGLAFMKETYDFDLESSVKCSNFIGQTMDAAVELGFTGLLLTGHAGKLVKVAGGMMNTHSREGDGRMEILAAAALREGVENEDLLRILDAPTTDAAFAILTEKGKADAVAKRLLEQIIMHLQKRTEGQLRIECVIYTSEQGFLAATDGAGDMIRILREEQEK